MSRPRILIPTPTSFDTAYNEKCWPEYAAAVTAAGGEAIALALTHSSKELEALVDEADGILLPGSGADVDRRRATGMSADAASAEPDDHCESRLTGHCSKLRSVRKRPCSASASVCSP